MDTLSLINDKQYSNILHLYTYLLVCMITYKIIYINQLKNIDAHILLVKLCTRQPNHLFFSEYIQHTTQKLCPLVIPRPTSEGERDTESMLDVAQAEKSTRYLGRRVIHIE